MRSGIVRDRLKFFGGMAPDDASPEYPIPPPPPELANISTDLPDPLSQPLAVYVVLLTTSNAKWSGTDKSVYIQLLGDMYTTDEIELCQDGDGDMQTSLRYFAPNNLNKATSCPDKRFPTGSIREFRFKAPPVGNLVKIRIHHDPTEDATAAWKLDRVVVRNEDLQRSWSFLCCRWLSQQMGNMVELKPVGEVSVGRRASRRAFRRLSSGKQRFCESPKSSGGVEHFETMRNRFGENNAADSTDSISKGAEGGTRRVCFQLQKFTNKSCHVYLSGDIPALGAWDPAKALRMTMQSGADGTWRGEWRLELELDDDSDEIQYTYMILNESDPRHNRRVSIPDRIRRFKLSAPDSLGRTTEGGRIHIRDSFGANKFGLPSASTPSLVLRRAFSRASLRRLSPERRVQSPVQTAQDDSDDPSTPKSMDSRQSAALTADQASEAQTLESDHGTESNPAVPDEDNLDVPTVESEDLFRNVGVLENGVTAMEFQEAIKSGSNGIHASREANGNLSRNGSPKEDIQRDVEAARREWEVQLDASDGQLFQSAQRLLRRQSEVAYLKKRNSQEVSDGQALFEDEAKSPERSSPVTSETATESESLPSANGHISEKHSEQLEEQIEANRLLAEEKDKLRLENEALRKEIEELEIERKHSEERESKFADVELTAKSLQQELEELKAKLSEQCEEFDAQQAELVRLVMDGQEAFRTSREQLIAERDSINARWMKEFKMRRKLFNTIQELRGNIRVFCRVRPLKDPMLEDGTEARCAMDFPDAAVEEQGRVQLGSKSFEFDHVFDPAASQKEVYDETAGVVASVLDGYNVCVFAYGQTGSGKTHTMNGPDNDRGVNYRALVDLFDIAAQRKEFADVRITVSMMEIYNENLRDLIREDEGPNTPKLDIRKDPNANSSTGVYVPNLTEVQVDSVENVWAVMEQGAANRSKGKTNMNEHSSRSHLILKVSVTCENVSSDVKTSGVLHLVDLAGSERVGRSNVSGDRLKEAQHINKSLATLGDVFMALLSHSTHVPYRNSKLTYLLQNCLGGDSKTLMFVNVSADEKDSAETLSSLQFAQRVAKVELGTAQKHAEKPAEIRASAQLQAKEREMQDIASKYSGLQREFRKREELAEERKQKINALEAELRSTKTSLEEVQRRKSAEREGSATGVRELQVQVEKGQAELRVAKQRTKDLVASKDDEISRLNTMLKAKDRRIAELNRNSMRPAERGLHRPLSTPSGLTKKPEKIGQNRVMRSSASFTARARQVRFEEGPGGSEEPSERANDDSVVLSSSTTPGTAARRAATDGTLTRTQTITGTLTRSQTMTGSRVQRQNSRTPAAAGSGAVAKTVTYAFGTRIESTTGGGAAQKPARNMRLPRSQTNFLRPAQRVSQAQNARTSEPSLGTAGRIPSASRRTNAAAGAHRPQTRTTQPPSQPPAQPPAQQSAQPPSQQS